MQEVRYSAASGSWHALEWHMMHILSGKQGCVDWAVSHSMQRAIRQWHCSAVAMFSRSSNCRHSRSSASAVVAC